MSRWLERTAWVTLCLALAVWAPGAAQAPATPRSALEAHKKLANDFFEFRGPREERAQRFMTEDYVQHNPRFLRMDEITGAQGREAWIEAGEEATRRGVRLVDLGGIRLRDPVLMVAEGDLMVAIYRGNLSDPHDGARTYEAFAFEAFRFRDGKFAEHWDQVALAPGWMTGQPQAQ